MSQLAEVKHSGYKDIIRGWAQRFVIRFILKPSITPNRVTVTGAALALIGCVVWTQQLRWPWVALVGMVIVVLSCLSDLLALFSYLNLPRF